MPRIKSAEKRLKIIDQLLSQRERILNRAEFVRKINKRLDSHEQISDSSLSKDIAYLNELIERRGVRIICSHSRGYHYTQEGFSYYKNEVNEKDKNLLLLASSLFSLFQGTPLQEKFGQLVNKVLSESLVAGKVKDLSDFQLVQLGAGPAVKGSQWLPALLDAILAKDALEMIYQGIGKPEKKKHICPYLIKKHLNRWFLVAYDHTSERKQKTSVFALDGIRSLDISNRKYLIDPEFIPEDYFRYSIGIWHFHDQEPIRVELEFTGYIEQILNAPLHHSQQSKLSADGKKLKVEIEVYDSPELEMLIRNFGSKVKVISPATLADKIKEEAKKVMDKYA